MKKQKKKKLFKFPSKPHFNLTIAKTTLFQQTKDQKVRTYERLWHQVPIKTSPIPNFIVKIEDYSNNKSPQGERSILTCVDLIEESLEECNIYISWLVFGILSKRVMHQCATSNLLILSLWFVSPTRSLSRSGTPHVAHPLKSKKLKLNALPFIGYLQFLLGVGLT